MSELTDALQKLFDEYGERVFMEGVMSLPYYVQFTADAREHAQIVHERQMAEWRQKSADLLARLQQFNKQS